jgi:hypothetical protein
MNGMNAAGCPRGTGSRGFTETGRDRNHGEADVNRSVSTGAHEKLRKAGLGVVKICEPVVSRGPVTG